MIRRIYWRLWRWWYDVPDRSDLSDLIYDITPDDTPFYTLAKKRGKRARKRKKK